MIQQVDELLSIVLPPNDLHPAVRSDAMAKVMFPQEACGKIYAS